MGKRSKGKARVHDPAEAARKALAAAGRRAAADYTTRHAPDRWGPNAEALRHDQNSDVSITEATREKTARLKRWDCFETLHIEAGALLAVRRYQDELAIRHGVEGSSRMDDKIDGGGSAELVSQRSLDAARKLDGLAKLIADPWMLTLIRHLCEPMVLKAERVNWHGVVRKDLGLIDRDAQARAVKVAAEGVRRAWEAYDQGGMRRAA